MSEPAVSPRYQKVLDFVRAAGDEAWEQIGSAKVVATKDAGCDVTTNFDRKIEQAFYELCKADFPGCGFIGEELRELVTEPTNGRTWLIDPIDGTKFYAKSIPLWAVTICLVKGDTPIFGVIYNPVSRQMYMAERGKGAYLNGVRMHIDSNLEPHTAQLAFDSFTPKKNGIHRTKQHALLACLFDDFYRVRDIGLGSLSLAWVAQGLFGGYLGWGVAKEKFMDIAAGLIIAEEAGATLDTVPIGNGRIAAIAAAPKIAAHLRKVVQQ